MRTDLYFFTFRVLLFLKRPLVAPIDGEEVTVGGFSWPDACQRPKLLTHVGFTDETTLLPRRFLIEVESTLKNLHN
jgi:hypothetical protein